jgi:transcriptional antiterminator RfaH
MYWAVAQVESQREQTAANFLGQGGFDTYLPQLRVGKRRMTPLFPGYLFVQIVERWYPARWSVGVVRLLMAGDHPAKVPDRILSAIRQREDREGLIRLPKSGLQLGQKVRVIHGPFTGHCALFAGQASHERVAILLAMLGGQTRLTLPKGDVEPT